MQFESQLVSAGGDLKIWNSSSATYDLVHNYVPGATAGAGSSSGPPSVFSTTWSCDTSAVASIIKGQDQILLTFYRNKKYISTELDTPGVSGHGFLQFPRTSQSQLFISSRSDLFFYDISKKKTRKTFNFKFDISCFVPNQTDSYIAVGGTNGSIVLATVASNQMSLPMTAPKCTGHKVTSIRYSFIRPAFLANSCENGTVSFWDCNANKNLFNISEHMAPCTSFTFSPVNDCLAASCGLDKRLICLDTKTKRSVFNLQLDQPCTAVDFDLDGQTVGVGTSRGKIVIYDMRNTSTPIKSMQAHDGKVNNLVFKHKVDKNNVSLMMSAMKSSSSKSRLRNQKSHPNLVTVQEETKENVCPDFRSHDMGGKTGIGGHAKVDFEQPEKLEDFPERAAPLDLSDCSVFSSLDARRESISSQLFSPLRDPAELSFSGQIPNQYVISSGGRKEVRLSSEGVFSPLQDGGGSGNSSFNFARKTSYSNFSTPVTMSPLTCIQEEGATSGPGSPLKSPAKNMIPAILSQIGKDAVEGKADAERQSSAPALSVSTSTSGVAKSSEDVRSKSMETDREHIFSNRRSISQTHSEGSTIKLSLEKLDEYVRTNVTSSSSASSLEDNNPGGGFMASSTKPRAIASVNQSSGNKLVDLSEREVSPNTVVDLQSVLTAFPCAASSLGSTPDEFARPEIQRMEAERLNTNDPVEKFSRNYVQMMVKDAIQDWMTDMETRLTNMHYGLIRQQQQHQEETKGLLAEITGLNQLRLENEQLRQENEELRKLFSRGLPDL